MGSWGRKTSDFCDRCAETFPDLLEDRLTATALHEEVRRRLAEFPLCERCFDTYQRTAELCRSTAREMPRPLERLLDKLRTCLATDPDGSPIDEP